MIWRPTAPDNCCPIHLPVTVLLRHPLESHPFVRLLRSPYLLLLFQVGPLGSLVSSSFWSRGRGALRQAYITRSLSDASCRAFSSVAASAAARSLFFRSRLAFYCVYCRLCRGALLLRLRLLSLSVGNSDALPLRSLRPVALVLGCRTGSGRSTSNYGRWWSICSQRSGMRAVRRQLGRR